VPFLEGVDGAVQVFEKERLQLVQGCIEGQRGDEVFEGADEEQQAEVQGEVEEEEPERALAAHRLCVIEGGHGEVIEHGKD
jgi:hypothetical protein